MHGARRGPASAALRRILSVQAVTMTAPRAREMADRTGARDAGAPVPPHLISFRDRFSFCLFLN